MCFSEWAEAPECASTLLKLNVCRSHSCELVLQPEAPSVWALAAAAAAASGVALENVSWALVVVGCVALVVCLGQAVRHRLSAAALSESVVRLGEAH